MYQMSQQYAPVSNTRMGSYSRLESIAQSYQGNVAYAVADSPSVEYSPSFQYTAPVLNIPAFRYQGLSQASAYRNNLLPYTVFQSHQEYHFEPDHFLKPGKEGIFVGKAVEIREHIETAFEKMFFRPFPADIKISICNEKEFRAIASSPGVIGLSFNRKRHSLLSEIFVLNDYLGRVMLTIGHELGHVLTETLGNAQNEEAKAYSFSFAWMKTVKEHNIAGLQEAIVLENPAQNGLHNIAFNFVDKELRAGKSAWEVYTEIVEKEINLMLV
ncbi:MAG: hypothetical protein Q8R37_00150 [Nanoarchaeota archaeon]|nr:hypothetical protein [Nanoarchaeota archaeon]